jgi:hypothetical protein
VADEEAEAISPERGLDFGSLTIDILAFGNAMPRSVAKVESGGAPNVLARRQNNEQGLAAFPCNLDVESRGGLLTCRWERRILPPSMPKTTDGHFNGSL